MSQKSSVTQLASWARKALALGSRNQAKNFHQCYPALFTIPCAWLIFCLHFLLRQIPDAASLPDRCSGFVLRIAGFVG
jgi:hypothetical protein